MVEVRVKVETALCTDRIYPISSHHSSDNFHLQQAKRICEMGLEVGSSSLSCLGDPSMGKQLKYQRIHLYVVVTILTMT